MKDGQKLLCIDDSNQKVLRVGRKYTVDASKNTTEDRVYVKENKRFSFLLSRFEVIDAE